MKKCPKCKEEIQEDAKKCKHCSADLRNWFVKHKFLTGILLFIILIVVTSSDGENIENKNTTVTNTSKETQNTKVDTAYSVDEMISVDKLEITITNVEERNQVGGAYFNEPASEGATLVVVDWKYKNISDKPLSSFSNPTVKLIDEKGTEYESDLGKTSIYATEADLDSKVLSDLNPGITVKDAKVFEISKESFSEGQWKLKVKFNGESYFVNL